MIKRLLLPSIAVFALLCCFVIPIGAVGPVTGGTTSSSSSLLTGKTLFVDATNGSNTTGTRGDQTKPYLTLTAAKTAAQSGDTIHVRPGTFNENNLLKNGANWYFEPGAKVIYTAVAWPAGGIFDDSSRGANTAITSMIGGYGHFETGDLALTLIPAGVIFIANASSNVSVSCDSITRTGGAYGYGVAQSAGILNVNVLRTIDAHDYAAVWWSNGEMRVTADQLGPTSGTGAAFDADDGGAPTGAAFISAVKIIGTGSIPLIRSGANANARIWITAQHIIGTAGVPAVSCVNGLLYVTAQKVQAAFDYAINAQGGTLYLDAAKVENTAGAAVFVQSGTAILTINEAIAAADAPIVDITAGDLTLYNANLTKTNAGAALGAGAGTVRLVNCYLKTIVGSYPVDDGSELFDTAQLNATVKLQNCVLVSAETSSIHSTSFGGTIKVYNGCSANVAAGAGVTFTVGSLTVDPDVQ